eukprot:2762936-Prymnesium_polylepis.1
MMLDQRHSTGMPLLTTAAMKEFAQLAVILCNAFKMKLMRPRGKPVDNEADDEATTCGKLDTLYILLWVAPQTPGLAFMRGCSEISAETINQKEKEVVAACMTYSPGETVRIIRTGSLSAIKSKERAAALADMLIHAQFSPPGQHSYIGDVEKWFYPL